MNYNHKEQDFAFTIVLIDRGHYLEDTTYTVDKMHDCRPSYTIQFKSHLLGQEYGCYLITRRCSVFNHMRMILPSTCTHDLVSHHQILNISTYYDLQPKVDIHTFLFNCLQTLKPGYESTSIMLICQPQMSEFPIYMR